MLLPRHRVYHKLLLVVTVLTGVFLSLERTTRSLLVVPIQHHDLFVPDDTNTNVSLINIDEKQINRSITTTISKFDNDDNDGDNNLRAIFIISMGQQASESNLVERFVYSARTLGNYYGFIILLTDAPNRRYDHIHGNFSGANGVVLPNIDKNETKIHDDDRFIVMTPLPHHYRNNFKHKDMVFKRFKTFVLDYVALDARLQSVQLVYYLDVDIIVVKPMLDFFHALENMYNIRSNNHLYHNTDNSTIWMFKGNAMRIPVQGGQMILDVRRSAGCLQRWRHLMDRNWKTRKDQFSLMRMWKEQQPVNNTKGNGTTLHKIFPCKIVLMEQFDFVSFPSREEIDEQALQLLQGNSPLPRNETLIHIRNTGSAGTKVNETIHEVFVRNALQFSINQEDTLGITKRMNMMANSSDLLES